MIRKYISILWATGLGTGFFPLFPGTIGSLVACGLIYWLYPLPLLPLIGMLVLLFFSGVWAAGEAEHYLGHDAHSIVIDEVFGMMLAMILLPVNWKSILIALVLFRIFDVWKPLWIDNSQNLPRGWGI
ncbi:MAG: phosphatidylglycerophosphatase A, partial [Candidatus Delongbacteria bacterium]|nr:phosphatidylglycerophosphatase A [Candidatus Delongbacteria bacterium]